RSRKLKRPLRRVSLLLWLTAAAHPSRGAKHLASLGYFIRTTPRLKDGGDPDTVAGTNARRCAEPNAGDENEQRADASAGEVRGLVDLRKPARARARQRQEPAARRVGLRSRGRPRRGNTAGRGARFRTRAIAR